MNNRCPLFEVATGSLSGPILAETCEPTLILCFDGIISNYKPDDGAQEEKTDLARNSVAIQTFKENEKWVSQQK